MTVWNDDSKEVTEDLHLDLIEGSRTVALSEVTRAVRGHVCGMLADEQWRAQLQFELVAEWDLPAHRAAPRAAANTQVVSKPKNADAARFKAPNPKARRRPKKKR